jgi:hypothetical protein
MDFMSVEPISPHHAQTTTISNSTPFMRERLAAIRDQPVLARFRDVPTLDANYDYEPDSYSEIVARHQRERRPCVIRGCFEPPEDSRAHHGLTSWLERERVLSDDHLEPMLWIDDEDRISPLHYDNFDNQTFVASGTKIFLLYSPRQHAFLYHPWGRLGRERLTPLDIENPDFERFPLYRKASPQIAVITRGDMLYIPADWSHQVYTIDCARARGITMGYWYPVKLRELWREPSAKLSFALWTSAVNLGVRARRILTGSRTAVPEPTDVLYTLSQDNRGVADRYGENLSEYLEVLGSKAKPS